MEQHASAFLSQPDESRLEDKERETAWWNQRCLYTLSLTQVNNFFIVHAYNPRELYILNMWQLLKSKDSSSESPVT